ncbi:hypothetical protein [Streptomyces sp. NPDC101455]|uniref:hypothetical protein n=1 Tax=Streptomyces sp. NPDC101455 TaxID=3366142 RepID=UPI003823E33D
MSIDFNGSTLSACVPGDRTHEWRLPTDRSRIPARTQEALNAVEEATEAQRKAKTPAAKSDVAEALRTTVHDLYDRAASTNRADRETHREGYGYGAAKLARALGDVEAALQLMADHAAQYDNGTGIGFPLDRNVRTKPVMQLRLIADTISNLPAPLDLD